MLSVLSTYPLVSYYFRGQELEFQLVPAAFLSLKSSSSVDKDRVFTEAKEFSGIVELTELEELDES